MDRVHVAEVRVCEAHHCGLNSSRVPSGQCFDLSDSEMLGVEEIVMTSRAPYPCEAVDFWSTSYRGHDIATQRHYRGWLVYLNKVMQQDMVFGDARAAARWLRGQVDERVATAT